MTTKYGILSDKTVPMQEKFEREKESALEKLRQEHQREIHILEQRCSDTQLLNLEQK